MSIEAISLEVKAAAASYVHHSPPYLIEDKGTHIITAASTFIMLCQAQAYNIFLCRQHDIQVYFNVFYCIFTVSEDFYGYELMRCKAVNSEPLHYYRSCARFTTHSMFCIFNQELSSENSLSAGF
jgi:hypothetical protein